MNFRAIVLVLIGVVSMSLLHGEPAKRDRPTKSQSLDFDKDTRLDVNNLEMFVYNDGNFAYDYETILGKTDGLYFPRGTKKTVIYAAGIWVGAKVNDQVRVSTADYAAEFVPGPMVGGTYQPDNTGFRVYKIRSGDTPESNLDYANWPVGQGAPLNDQGLPLVRGNQTTWSVFNDANPQVHTRHTGSTTPLGLEIQQSCYGYARSGILGNSLFMVYKIINKGGNLLRDTYVSIWVDSDLGSAFDDLVGCDTILGLGYCYNGGLDSQYGANPPAVGIDVLMGPIVPGNYDDYAYQSGEWRRGFRNLGMTSFNKYIGGSDPESAEESYGYMRGLTKDFANDEMVPLINPVTATPTTFAVSGDPVNQSGWIDEVPADRRMMLSTGPFDMAPGDTQEVAVAVIVAQGNSPVNSVSLLKTASLQVQSQYASRLTLCSDYDHSGDVSLVDLLLMIRHIFKDGPAPADAADADVDCDGQVRITDCVYLINYLFLGGQRPCAGCQQ